MNQWQQIPTTDQIEDFVGADDITGWELGSAIVVIVGSLIVAKLVRRVVRWLVGKFPRVTPEVAALVGRAAGWLVVLIGVVYGLVLVGINMVPALMIIIILSIVLFFAGRRIMENFSAGLVLQTTPMFGPGDEIITPSGTGVVREITGRTVVVEAPDGEVLHIPNKVVIDGAITNLTHLGTRRSIVDIGVAYGTDLELAKSVIEKAAAACPETQSYRAPEALFSEFDDDAIKFELLIWHAPTIMEELHAIDAVGRSIARAFADNGIVIAFPQRTLWWGDDTSGPPDALDR